MKTAIVYYSMSGNTQYVAETILHRLEKTDMVDLVRVEPQKAYPSEGAKKFIWGGKSAVMGEKPKLLPYAFEADKYERIIIGTPVWAGTFAPPIRSFLHANKHLKNKEVSIFACCSGDGEKAIDKMKKYLGVDKVKATLVLVDPKEKMAPENDDKISAFCDGVLQEKC